MPGARLNNHYNPFSQRGGLMHYPLSGVFSGLEVTSGATGGHDASDVSLTDIDISAGEVILDSERFNFPAQTAVNVETNVDLDSTETTVEVWLVPTRKVPALTSGTPAAPSEGDIYIKVNDFDDYQIVDGFYKYNGAAWELIDDVRDIPYTPGNQNSYSLNAVDPSISATNFSLTNEKRIYHKTAVQPYAGARPHAVLREPGGFRLATISYPGDGTTPSIEGIDERDYIRI